MEVQAVEKYIRISPKKARLVADMVRGGNAKQSLTLLKFVPKKAAKIIYKALKSAVANAENNFNLDGGNLVIAKISVDSGPTLKRFRPGAKGMAKPLKKRTSHVTVVVSDTAAQTSTKKSIAPKPKNEKVKTEAAEKTKESKKEATEGSK